MQKKVGPREETNQGVVMNHIAIIGAGISGLATAFAIERQAAMAGLRITTTLVEKEQRVGGKIWSRQEDGFLCEWGPNGFLDNKPMTLELCRQLQIDSQLLRSDDNARKRFIYSRQALHRLPENGPAFLRSKLMSWPGKLRLAAELLIPQKKDKEDETLAEFGRRRLGPEALDKLIAPMVSGIFAGDPEAMSLRSCFPRIHELEQEYGGLLQAMLRLAKKKRAERKAGKAVASAAGPGGVLTSFSGGIQELTDALAGVLQAELISGRSVEQLEPQSKGYRLRLDDGTQLEADMVVVATPAFAAAAMMEALIPECANILQQIPYAPMNVVCCGYQHQNLDCDLNGFGYLIPRAEGRSILGTLWDSSIFPGRAPEGRVLLRSMMGGATNKEAIKLTDTEIERRVREDLRQIMGIDCEPDFIRIYRHSQAIPQYTKGHGDKLVALAGALGAHPGLFLTGNAYRGIGLNDCISAANVVAGQVVKLLGEDAAT
jgi:oxygen-dependent protoporphyrinogen oxidase